jgi:3-oxoacyl-[acyl-carrier-protein] synthase II
MKRVVVTGIGLVTPLGVGTENIWKRLTAGESGIRAIQSFDVSDLPAKIAGQVPRGDTASGLFNADDWVPPKDQRKMDEFILYAMGAAEQAVADSGWKPEGDEEHERTGVMIGSGIGGLPGITEGAITLHERGPRRLSPFFIPSNLINLASGHVSIRYGYRGPNHAVVTACSTGAHAIGDAARLIMWDDADVMVAGGAEAAVCRLGIAGFAAARALSTGFNDEPSRASRPWDQKRDGFVMGEGAGFLVLEAADHARRRGVTALAELAGYGTTCDAYRVTDEAPDGRGAIGAMRRALADAELGPGDVDYVNAHGTSTPMNDRVETAAIKTVFGTDARRLLVSSTKSMLGHTISAAGAIELATTVLAVRDQIAPPTINYRVPDPECDLNYVPNTAAAARIRAAISNSFGFGGHNDCLLVREAGR